MCNWKNVERDPTTTYNPYLRSLLPKRFSKGTGICVDFSWIIAIGRIEKELFQLSKRKQLTTQVLLIDDDKQKNNNHQVITEKLTTESSESSSGSYRVQLADVDMLLDEELTTTGWNGLLVRTGWLNDEENETNSDMGSHSMLSIDCCNASSNPASFSFASFSFCN